MVTPHVGVWIETILVASFNPKYSVTPHVGVWIETSDEMYSRGYAGSHLM